MFNKLNIHHVWIIGSEARGNRETGSDIDILMVSKGDKSELLLPILKESFPPESIFDICHYTHEGIQGLVASGSLFAWHIKKESRPIFDKNNWLNKCLENLSAYSNHLNDISTLLELSQDVLNSVMESSLSSIYDAGILSTSVRNTSIIMSDHIGCVDFSPRAHLTFNSLAPQEIEMPLNNDDIDMLLSCRRESERGVKSYGSRCLLSLPDIASKVIRWQENCIKFIGKDQQ